jgi:hypothetical protein
LSVDIGKVKQSLLAAIDQAEHGMVRRRAIMESRQTAREDLLAEIRQLHDAVLRLRCAAEGDDLGCVEEGAFEALSDLCDRLRDVVLADEVPSVTAQVADACAQPSTTQPSKPGAPAEPESIDPEDHLRPIYQEILTLEENQGLFDADELRDRVVLLLARMRDVQDGEVGRIMDVDQRVFMTTRFGLLESLQKRRNLGYMNELNRRHHTDWKAVIDSLENHLSPLKERIGELSAERDQDKARRRAAAEHAARRRMEGEEILDELRLFLRGRELHAARGLAQFRRLVAEAMSCLPPGYTPLHEIVDPHLDLLEGKDFKGLRQSSRRLEPQVPPEAPEADPRPSTEADHEERLKGAFEGQHAVILGGQPRERAEQILQEHLGFDRIDWIGARTLAVEGPESAEALLDEERTTLCILLVDSLGESLVRRLRAEGQGGLEILVRGGQEVSRILSALRGPEGVGQPVHAPVEDRAET